MATPRILVHEYVTGGGWPGPELPPGLAAEALALLQATLAEFRDWGQAHTITTLDPRLSPSLLAADRVIPLQPHRHHDALLELAMQCDAALIIAPETDGIVARLSRWLEGAGVMLLGATAEAATIAADKWLSYQLFRQNAIPTPETCLLDHSTGPHITSTLGLPLVLKPRQGTGAEGVRLVTDPATLSREMARARARTEQYLVQSFVSGVHASISLLSNGSQTLPLSLNRQNIHEGTPFTYQGGSIPLEHPLQKRAFALAQRAVSLIPGLLGYVGVDLILSPEQCYLIEINPRITTSFVGLRWVVDFNLAQAIWQVFRTGHLPTQTALTGSISFGKDGTYG